MIFLVSAIIWLTAAGLGMLTLAVHTAPEGYEDERGFHRLR